MRRSRSRAAIALGAALAACGAPPASSVAPAPARCTLDPRTRITITRQADVARVAGCTVLAGVTIRSGAALDLAPLASLLQVTGDLTIGPTVGLDALTLGGLHVVGGTLRVVGNGLAQGVFLRQLERAGPIAIDGNPALTTIALPQLTVAAALRVTDNASLELLDLGALTTVADELVITGAPRLTILDAPQLQTAGRVELNAPQVPDDVTTTVVRASARSASP